MFFHTYGFPAVLLAVVSGVAIAAPAPAAVSLAWARVRTSTNQVSLVSTDGASRPASNIECFCPGDILSTSTQAQAEVLFNDGSLARIGEQASLRFWPNTRQLTIDQGTAAVFVPPNQGRTTIQTPNATVGLNSSGVVVRYVPSRGLTLVMALANSATGPVSVTTTETGQDFALYAGQMAFISLADLQIVEFDLLEFYQTSSLMAGLHLGDSSYRPPANEPLAALRPELLKAIDQQPLFDSQDFILDPTLISDFASGASPQSAEAEQVVLPSPTEELRHYNETPPGVVMPLPTEPLPTEPLPTETLPTEPAEPAIPIEPTAPIDEALGDR